MDKIAQAAPVFGRVDPHTLTEWAEQVEMAWTAVKRTPWRLGDLVVAGIDAFTNGTPGEIRDLLDLISEQAEASPKTLENYARIARAFPEDARVDALELSHHEAVVSKPEPERHAWLRLAAENGWSVRRLRLEVRLTDAVPDRPVTLPHPIAVERAFFRAGVKSLIGARQARFSTPAGVLVVTSATDMTWELEQ